MILQKIGILDIFSYSSKENKGSHQVLKISILSYRIN